jgi:DNA-binding NarL/FixJ family response regulator
MAERSTVVLIRSMHPALEGVVRLASAAIPGVDKIRAIEPSGLPAAVVASPSAIVVFDLQQASTLAEVGTICQLDTDPRVVLLVDTLWDGSVLAAMRLGVRGFVRVPDALKTLPEVLLRAAGGGHAIPPDLEQAAIRELGRSVQQARAASGPPLITIRERQVLQFLADGFTTHQIGRRLGISPRTVEGHVGRLYHKLTVRSRVQAISRGSALGLIELG